MGLWSVSCTCPGAPRPQPETSNHSTPFCLNTAALWGASRGRQARGTIQALPLASSVMGALFPGHPAGMGMQTAEKKAAGTQSLRRCGVTVLVSRGNTRSWRFLWEAVLNPDRSPGLGVQSLGFRQLFFLCFVSFVLVFIYLFLAVPGLHCCMRRDPAVGVRNGEEA